MQPNILTYFQKTDYIGELPGFQTEIFVEDEETSNKIKVYMSCIDGKLIIRYKILASSIGMALAAFTAEKLSNMTPVEMQAYTFEQFLKEFGEINEPNMPCVRQFFDAILEQAITTCNK